MRCGLCGFLIIKPQIALHHVERCDAVHCYLWCSVVIPFCRQFWCGLCDLMNTPLKLALRFIILFFWLKFCNNNIYYCLFN